MGSESRLRTKMLPVRMTDDEYDTLFVLAQHQRCSMAEMARAILFDRDPVSDFPGCSSRHVGCTPHHRDLIDRYDDQHRRELARREDETGNYAGDLAQWRASGGTLTTFKDWLVSNGGGR